MPILTLDRSPASLCIRLPPPNDLSPLSAPVPRWIPAMRANGLCITNLALQASPNQAEAFNMLTRWQVQAPYNVCLAAVCLRIKHIIPWRCAS